jgi:hypothetical protein
MAGALSRLVMAMIDVHERTCEIPERHNWERCTSTPTIYAVADGLDLLDAAPKLSVSVLPDVAMAMHNRECRESDCGLRGLTSRRRHVGAWSDQATALLGFVSAEQAHLF